MEGRTYACPQLLSRVSSCRWMVAHWARWQVSLPDVSGWRTYVEDPAHGAARAGPAGVHTCHCEGIAHERLPGHGAPPMVTVLVLLLFSLVLLLSEDAERRPSTPHTPS